MQERPGTVGIVFEVVFTSLVNLLLAVVAGGAGILFLTHGHGWALLAGVGLVGYAIYGLWIIANNIFGAIDRARS